MLIKHVMHSCLTLGHLWGARGSCLYCETPKPEQPANKCSVCGGDHVDFMVHGASLPNREQPTAHTCSKCGNTLSCVSCYNEAHAQKTFTMNIAKSKEKPNA